MTDLLRRLLSVSDRIHGTTLFELCQEAARHIKALKAEIVRLNKLYIMAVNGRREFRTALIEARRQCDGVLEDALRRASPDEALEAAAAQPSQRDLEAAFAAAIGAQRILGEEITALRDDADKVAQREAALVKAAMIVRESYSANGPYTGTITRIVMDVLESALAAYDTPAKPDELWKINT